MNNIKTLEKLNMEVIGEVTAEEVTQKFINWVNKKLDVCENMLSIAECNLDDALNEGMLLGERMFNGKFEIIYYCIKEDIRLAESKCKSKGISDEVLECAIKAFKQMKSKVRKVKSEYKKKFMELTTAIEEAKLNDEQVSNVRNQVQEQITNWCTTHVIKDCYKSEFVGDRLTRNIEILTNCILSTKLNPSISYVVKYVENFMRCHTVNVAC